MALATATAGEFLPAHVDRRMLTSWALRAADVLTTSYVASDHMKTEGGRSVLFDVEYDENIDYTSIELIPQGSPDGTTWFDLTDAESKTLANAFATPGTAGNVAFTADIRYGGIRFVRCAIKRTGGTAVGTVAVTGYLGA